MNAHIIQDRLFGYDIEIVTIGDDVTYYVFANLTPGRNWAVLSFSTMEGIVEEYMDNQLDYTVSQSMFAYKHAFKSKLEYDIYLNRRLSSALIVSCLN